jgi:hypothetical protein
MSKYEYEADFHSEVDDDYSENRNKVNKFMAEMNNDDKLCFVRKTIGHNGKQIKTLIFGSGQIGTTIRNAVTGERHSGHKVGSHHEDLYFKTAICTGEFGPDPVTLFYDSASQFEKHLGGTVNQYIKESVALRQRDAALLREEEVKPRFVTLVK